MNKLKSKVNLNTELTKSKQKNSLGMGGGGEGGTAKTIFDLNLIQVKVTSVKFVRIIVTLGVFLSN